MIAGIGRTPRRGAAGGHRRCATPSQRRSPVARGTHPANVRPRSIDQACALLWLRALHAGLRESVPAFGVLDARSVTATPALRLEAAHRRSTGGAQSPRCRPVRSDHLQRRARLGYQRSRTSRSCDPRLARRAGTRRVPSTRLERCGSPRNRVRPEHIAALAAFTPAPARSLLARACACRAGTATCSISIAKRDGVQAGSEMSRSASSTFSSSSIARSPSATMPTSLR